MSPWTSVMFGYKATLGDLRQVSATAILTTVTLTIATSPAILTIAWMYGLTQTNPGMFLRDGCVQAVSDVLGTAAGAKICKLGLQNSLVNELIGDDALNMSDLRHPLTVSSLSHLRTPANIRARVHTRAWCKTRAASAALWSSRIL